MKNLILLLFLITFTSTLVHAQAVPEKSNAIVISQPDSAGAREKVLKVFADKDYTVNSGKTPAVITTASRTLKNGTRVSFSAQVKGTDIILMGVLPVAGQASQKIAYQGKKGTPVMNGWEEMEKIAKAMGGKVRYEIK